MKCAGRWLFNFAATVSTLMLLVAVVLWVTSAFARFDIRRWGSSWLFFVTNYTNGIAISGIHSQEFALPVHWEFFVKAPTADGGPIGLPESWFVMPGISWSRVAIDLETQPPSYHVEHRIIVAHWLLALLVLLLPAAYYARCRRKKRYPKGLCPTCGYDLRATPDLCPECGAVPPNKKLATI
jgi:hypothetical protein